MIIMQNFPPPCQLSQPLAPCILTQCESDWAGPKAERSLYGCVCQCVEIEREVRDSCIEGMDRGANGGPEFGCGDILRVRGGSLTQQMLVNLQ